MDEDEIKRLVEEMVSASVWPPADPDREPETVLTAWRVLQVPSGERHLVGWAGYEGRVSSPVCVWDPVARLAHTRSGRRYILQGPSGRNRDADWVWQLWAPRNGVTAWTEVSGEYGSGPDRAGGEVESSR